MKSSPEIIYAEFLTLTHLIQDILPALRKPSTIKCLYVFDVTRVVLLFSRIFGFVFGFKVKKLDFDMGDARDEQGACIFLRVRHQEIIRLQRFILQEYPLNGIMQDSNPRLGTYLAKAPVSDYDLFGYTKHSELWHALVLIGVAQWHKRITLAQGASIHLYMYTRPFPKALMRYANESGVVMHEIGNFRLTGQALHKIFSFVGKIELPLILNLLRHPSRLFLKNRPHPKLNNVFSSARIMTEHWGQFNLDSLERVSDVFFIHPQGILGKDTCLVFNNRKDPIDDVKYRQMSGLGIAAVARTIQSSLVDQAKVPVFSYQAKRCLVDGLPSAWRGHAREYQRIRDCWNHFFRTYNIKLWTSWYPDTAHIAMSDAIRDVGGISTIYQRSFETNPSPFYAAGSDIVFGFSLRRQNIHIESGSDFKYHIIVGYLGDYRFAHLHLLAKRIRKQLLKQGAQYIITYFDDNSIHDGRWLMGHKRLSENYAFWLRKIFEDQKLGIIFKPKAPGTLRKRLGPVADLLRAAEKTGRCYVFEEGYLFGSFPPAAAGLAGDIVIQDCLWAATAGIEAALSGSKTIFVDLEGWPLSPLCKLGPDVIFKDWPSVWEACSEFFRDPRAHPKLGDCSSISNELDPFRDGRAAERMSIYLKDLLEGLRRKESPNNVMEQAAERYSCQWGKDKVQRWAGK